MTDDPEFYAWLDGELNEAAAAAMAVRVADDPALAALAEQHRALGDTLRGAFDPIAAAPVPASLAEAARARAEVIDLAAARDKRRARFAGGWGRQATAMAASLVVGLLAGRMLVTERAAAPVELVGGQLVAASVLKESLSSGLASVPSASGPRIVLTFRDHAGAICRSFVDGAASGLACRDGQQWRLLGLFQGDQGQGGAYRMAAGPDPALAALVDAQIAGEPFDAASETAAKAEGWR